MAKVDSAEKKEAEMMAKIEAAEKVNFVRGFTNNFIFEK